MNTWTVESDIKFLSREQFVDKIFRTSAYHEHQSIAAVMTAVKLGDIFVDKTTTFERKYSIELAHAALALSSAYHDDQQHTDVHTLKLAAVEAANGIVFKMYNTLLSLVDYHIKPHEFIDLLSSLMFVLCKHQTQPDFHPSFMELAKCICLELSTTNQSEANPIVIFCACYLLHKHQRLKSSTSHKFNKLSSCFELLSEKYNVPLSDIVGTFIKLH